MLRILDEKFLFENTKIGQSFRPENFAFIPNHAVEIF